MAHSHRFDHEPLPEADSELARRDKQKVAGQSAASPGETEIHYGKKFAETEAILKARAEEHAALASEPEPSDEGPDQHLGSTEEQVTPSAGPPSSGAVADEVGMPGMARRSEGRKRTHRRAGRSAERDRTPPLGSMPAEELPPAAEQDLAETPGELLGAFADQVSRSLRGVGEAARQLRAASREVAGLPVEALRLVLRVGRSWLHRSPRRA